MQARKQRRACAASRTTASDFLFSSNHRLTKDYEWMVQTSETFIEVAMILLILGDR